MNVKTHRTGLVGSISVLLLDGEGEIGIGEGFVLHIARVLARLGIAAEVGVALGAVSVAKLDINR